MIKLRKPYLALAAAQRLTVDRATFSLVGASDCMERTTLMDRVYHAYETHTLALILPEGGEDERTIVAIYFALEDHDDGSLSLCVNAESHWMRTRFAPRFVPLPWFPYDVDPTRYGLKVNASRIPQRTPLWFKFRGEVTGTKAYTLLGYWVPSKERDPKWTLNGEREFSAAAQSAMRHGSRSENAAICAYLNARPEATVSAVGWCACSAPYPRTWGASPDGIISLPGGQGDDSPLGVLEIKTSRTSLSFEPYFLPQIYMEMIATNSEWCDLLRFMPPHRARIYRVSRHRPTEELIVGLIRRALATPSAKLQDTLLKGEDWVRAREYCAAVAAQLPYEEIAVQSIEPEWEAYKASKFL